MHNNHLYFCVFPCTIPLISIKSLNLHGKQELVFCKNCTSHTDSCCFMSKNIFVEEKLAESVSAGAQKYNAETELYGSALHPDSDSIRKRFSALQVFFAVAGIFPGIPS